MATEEQQQVNIPESGGEQEAQGSVKTNPVDQVANQGGNNNNKNNGGSMSPGLQTRAGFHTNLINKIQQNAQNNNDLIEQQNALTETLAGGAIDEGRLKKLTPQQRQAVQDTNYNQIAQQLGQVKFTMSERGRQFNDSVQFLQTGLEQQREEMRQQRMESRENILNGIEIMGSEAFANYSDKQLNKMEDEAGFQRGYLRNAKSSLQEQEEREQQQRELERRQAEQQMEIQREQVDLDRQQLDMQGAQFEEEMALEEEQFAQNMAFEREKLQSDIAQQQANRAVQREQMEQEAIEAETEALKADATQLTYKRASEHRKRILMEEAGLSSDIISKAEKEGNIDNVYKNLQRSNTGYKRLQKAMEGMNKDRIDTYFTTTVDSELAESLGDNYKRETAKRAFTERMLADLGIGEDEEGGTTSGVGSSLRDSDVFNDNFYEPKF